jgi:KUP system potassium uptake protein
MVSHCLDLTQRWATWSSQNSLGLKVREPLARGRVHAHCGFMEQPDLPALLDLARDRGYPVDPSKVTWLIGRETIERREDGRGLPWLIVTIVSFLVRNSSEAVDYFRLPRDEVVEIGRQFAI